MLARLPTRSEFMAAARRVADADKRGDWLTLACATDPADLWNKVVRWHSMFVDEGIHSHLEMLEGVLERLGFLPQP
jgi:hypothetical protein